MIHVSFDTELPRRLHTELGYVDLEDWRPGYNPNGFRKDLGQSCLESEGLNSEDLDPEDLDSEDLDSEDLDSEDLGSTELIYNYSTPKYTRQSLYSSKDLSKLGKSFRFTGYGLSKGRDWVLLNEKRLLWIPPDYRLRPDGLEMQVVHIFTGSGLLWENEKGNVVSISFREE
ncbi:hypothetical protein CSPX01_06269 [Colletotrichum filicis]|nr:hypothetical protein CSPX01_06269 [Colletotrichum filicis]